MLESDGSQPNQPVPFPTQSELRGSDLMEANSEM